MHCTLEVSFNVHNQSFLELISITICIIRAFNIIGKMACKIDKFESSLKHRTILVLNNTVTCHRSWAIV